MKRAVDSALKARLATIASVPKAWPNQDFDPTRPGNLPYVACEIVRASTDDDTLEGVDPIVTGRLIASVVVPKGTGETAADTIAEQLAALFPMGIRIPSGDITIVILQPPHIREGIGDGAYWRVAVTVPFQASKQPAP